MQTQNRNKLIMIYILEVVGGGLLLYAVNGIAGGGVYADEHHISGAIPTPDIAILLISILLIGSATVLFWHVTSKAIRHAGANSTYRRLMFSTIGSMASLAVGFLFPFLILSIGLGIWALFLSFKRDNRAKQYTVATRIINIVVLLTVIIGTILSFFRG